MLQSSQTSSTSAPSGKPPPTPKKAPRVRMTNPCDPCALRRVRCQGGVPCKDCRKRGLPCTFLRPRKKRGPQGPRQTTSNKIIAMQQDLLMQISQPLDSEIEPELVSDGSPSTSCDGVDDAWRGSLSSTGRSPPDSQEILHGLRYGIWHTSPRPIEGPLPRRKITPIKSYRKFLYVFRDRLYPVWPVLCCENLLSRMVENPGDHDAWALAASVCAGVIGQLRLPEHQQRSPKPSASSPRPRGRAATPHSVTSHDFAADATHFRQMYPFRERPTVSSLLTSFFLHIYCVNTSLLGTAAFHLRESLTQAHMLGLHRSRSYAALDPGERELRLRVYWVLFVSERTFCIQRGLPTILKPIRLRPSPDEAPDGCSSGPIASFLHLTSMFTCLDGDLIDPSSASDTTLNVVQADGSLGGEEGGPGCDKIAHLQGVLASASSREGTSIGLDETQRVDISVTRNWIRILLWEYTVRHFPMSCVADDQAFSMLLPALVSREMLGLFSVVCGKSIRAHGFGMELKVFRIADSLLDVLACRGSSSQAGSMLVGSRDILHSLENVLVTVGGPESVFLGKLRGRMAEVELYVPGTTSYLQLPCRAKPAEVFGKSTGDDTACKSPRNQQQKEKMQYLEGDVSLDGSPGLSLELEEILEDVNSAEDKDQLEQVWCEVPEISPRAELE